MSTLLTDDWLTFNILQNTSNYSIALTFSHLCSTCYDGNIHIQTFGWRFIFHSMPNVLVSSTANRSFSYKISGVGYGGKSSLLKQVWALENKN